VVSGRDRQGIARGKRSRAQDEAIEPAGSGFAMLPWQLCGEQGEERLAREGISIRCLISEDQRSVDDPDADGVVAVLARAY
jgi:prolyl-tRNA synthetase